MVTGTNKDTVLITIQVVLANLPLIYIVLYIGLKIVRILRAHGKYTRLTKTNEKVTEMSASMSVVEACDLEYRLLMTESECQFAKHVVSDNEAVESST